MTITCKPMDADPTTELPEYSALHERQSDASLFGGGSGRRLGGHSGFRVDTPSNVLTATSTTWTLGPCAAMIDPGFATHQGMYGWATDSNVTGSGAEGVQAADATYPRKDIVYIQINDESAGDGSGSRNAPVLYLAGDPSADPDAPDLPARSFLVGTINVPQVGGGSPTVTLNPARFVAAGGIQPVFNAEDLATFTPYNGFTIRRMDLPGLPLFVHDGTAYNRVVGGMVGHDKNTLTSVGIIDDEVAMDAIASVALIKGHKYEVLYQINTVAGAANQAFAIRLKTQAVGAGGTAGITTFDDRTFWTSPQSGAGSTTVARGLYTPAADQTLRILATMERVVGSVGIDVSERILTIEDKGYLP